MEQWGPGAGGQEGLGYKEAVRGRPEVVVVLQLGGELLQQGGHTHGVWPGAGTEAPRPEVWLGGDSRVDEDDLTSSGGQAREAELTEVLLPGDQPPRQLAQ